MRDELLYPYEREYLKIANKKILVERIPVLIGLFITVAFPILLPTTYFELASKNIEIANFYNMLPIIFGVIIALSMGQLIIMKGGINSIASKKKDMELNLGDSYLMEKSIVTVILMFAIGGFISEINMIGSATYNSGNNEGRNPFIIIAVIIMVLYLAFKMIFNTVRNVACKEIIEVSIKAINENNYEDAIMVLEEEGKNLTIWGVDYTLLNRYLLYNIKSAYESRNEMSEEEVYTSELITNICHDIRTPLTSIVNYSTLLKREDITKEERVEFEEILEKKKERLKGLKEEINGILSSEEIGEEKEEINLKELILEAIENNLEKNKGTAIEVVEVYEKNLYENRAVVARIAQNLISNIYKYSKRGSKAFIYIEENEIRFINESMEEINESPEKLTRRFIRGDKSRNTSGYGLGLDIVKNLVNKIGGTLKVEVEDKKLFKVKIVLEK